MSTICSCTWRFRTGFVETSVLDNTYIHIQLCRRYHYPNPRRNIIDFTHWRCNVCNNMHIFQLQSGRYDPAFWLCFNSHETVVLTRPLWNTLGEHLSLCHQKHGYYPPLWGASREHWNVTHVMIVRDGLCLFGGWELQHPPPNRYPHQNDHVYFMYTIIRCS